MAYFELFFFSVTFNGSQQLVLTASKSGPSREMAEQVQGALGVVFGGTSPGVEVYLCFRRWRH